MGADVAVLAPVAGEGAVHAGQAAAEREKRAALGQRRDGVPWGAPRDASAGQHPSAIPHLRVGRSPRAWGEGCAPAGWEGRRLHTPDPRALPTAGRGEAAFPAPQGLCPSRSGHAPSSVWQADPAHPAPGRGPSSRLWELYSGSLKGDFSKKRQNKGSAPRGNGGESTRLMHAH